ncbi:MAG: Laminin G, domain-containing 2 [Candidatus Collierbacteria bacterium GW2011_GWC2_44_18]|uniref:Laminin G, domain-containing 2 n=2 Tax=Microgenomates group TaxID=1794810 RepID=A0A0G1J6W9_9BACT|nr:MAG: Laminin G, domain-containing 2 [Microgenomates group bacterium GW2011_GWC1_44_10]KKT49817.1 MAG: Laminin G, domain-containing 2 [Candidatus Collierbacteria bacterium GW2011_GWC2_44_18]KKT67401.1 MAG: Laminin G, domain-containing 2 [Candidatus Woesebacteria bacterium GW2011_GWA2_44_33]
MAPMKKQKTIVSALWLLISLVVIFSVALLLQKRNFSDQSRASSGTVLVGQLIRSTSSSLCSKCVQQCPGSDNVLHDCNPMASNGISIDSVCNQAGKVETCGGKTYCCPKPKARWTANLTECPGATPAVKPLSPYRLLKKGGLCTALVIDKDLAEPLVGQQVVATGTLKEPYFYASKLSSYTPTPTRTPTPTKTPTPTSSDNQPPKIITTSLPSGYVNKSYTASVDASDIDTGDALTMTISGLPFGLNTGPCGVPVGGGKITCYISGTPIQSGLFNIKVYVSDNRGGSSSKSLPLSIVTQSTKVTPTPIGPPVVAR